jgi:hypothetical protein
VAGNSGEEGQEVGWRGKEFRKRSNRDEIEGQEGERWEIVEIRGKRWARGPSRGGGGAIGERRVKAVRRRDNSDGRKTNMWGEGARGGEEGQRG